MAAAKAPSGRRIWKAVRDELMLNLYPLPYSTLAPAVYHVYLHPEDFESIEPVAPRIVAQIQRALADEVQKLNRGLERSNRRVLSRLLDRETLAAAGDPGVGLGDSHHRRSQRRARSRAAGNRFDARHARARRVRRHADDSDREKRGRTRATDGDDDRRPPGLPHRRRRRRRRCRGPRDSTRARLTYEDEQGPHVFVMRKESLSVGRGGSSAWVDVQIVGSSKVSREHFRLRCDTSGRFYIQDVSLWGTSVDGNPIPPAVKTPDGVSGPGVEFPLPPQSADPPRRRRW